MTQPDLSSLALPDSPELPAEIEAAIRDWMKAEWAFISLTPWHPDIHKRWVREEREAKSAKARSVIAKHLLTAEEAQHQLSLEVPFTMQAHIFGCDSCRGFKRKLRRLSGSSRGEE